MNLTGIFTEIPSNRQFPLLFLVTVLITFSAVPVAQADDDLTDKITLLDTEFQALSLEIYQHNARDKNFKGTALPNISELEKRIERLTGNNQTLHAIQQLYRHVDLIQQNLDHSSVLSFLSLLLDNNELNLARRLFAIINSAGDDFQIASTKFLFAKYHADQLEWSKVYELLKDVPSKLTADNAAYALLLQGKALQQLKQHRRSQESYQKIPATSQYFRHAQLNLAIAHIRQGWLTSAKNTINELITNAEKEDADEFTNRLNLVLGYALLQKDYYRSARESFRKISLDSIYINRALLGIALCVINMGEFENGLNTLALLKSKKSTHLTVEESHLLIPYVYEKLQQEIDVATSYTQAMTHYQNRIIELNKIINQHQEFTTIKISDELSSISIANNEFNYSKQFAQSFIKNYQQLLRYSATNKSHLLAAKIEHQLFKHDQLFQLIVAQLVNQKIDHLNSYLSQSRFGLAKLYDKSKQEKQ